MTRATRARRVTWGVWAVIVFALVGAACGEDEVIAVITEDGRDITFTSGEFEVVADLYTPDTPGPHPAVIVVHGDGPQTRSSTPGTSDLRRIFTDAGYAVFVWDKPGSGASTGEFDQGELLRQRAAIVADAVAVLMQHPAIDDQHIGLWGISQAGWVMPLALELTDDVAFMIVVSGGGEDSIEQLAYQLGQDRVCAGAPSEVAEIVEEHFPPTAKGPTYGDYTAAMEHLVQVDGWETFAGPAFKSEEEWSPWPSDIDAYFDPMTVIDETTIPIRVVFGDLDRYVDPVQGAAAYETALQTSGNTNYQIELLDGVGHTMLAQPAMCSSVGPTSTRYLELLEQWADELK